jgi:hypothetical protein
MADDIPTTPGTRGEIERALCELAGEQPARSRLRDLAPVDRHTLARRAKAAMGGAA